MHKEDIVRIGDVFKHFKGGSYVVTGLSLDRDNPNKKKVTYVAMQPSSDGKYPKGTIWNGDLIIFSDDAREGIKRFTKVGSTTGLIRMGNGTNLIISQNGQTLVDVRENHFNSTLKILIDENKFDGCCPFTGTVTSECSPSSHHKCISCSWFIN